MDSTGGDNLQFYKPDGSLLSRIEMETQIRQTWVKLSYKRINANKYYGLPNKPAQDMKPAVLLHWILDEMVRRGHIVGDVLGVSVTNYNDEAEEAQLTQKLVALIQVGQALTPQTGEGFNMSMPAPPMPPAAGNWAPPAANFGGPPPGPPQGPPGFGPPAGPPAPGGYAPPQTQFAPPQGPPSFVQQAPVAPPQNFGPPPGPGNFGPPPGPPQGGTMAPPPGYPPAPPQAPTFAPPVAPPQGPPSFSAPPQQTFAAPPLPPQQGQPPTPPAAPAATQEAPGRKRRASAPPAAPVPGAPQQMNIPTPPPGSSFANVAPPQGPPVLQQNPGMQAQQLGPDPITALQGQVADLSRTVNMLASLVTMSNRVVYGNAQPPAGADGWSIEQRLSELGGPIPPR